MKAGTHLEAIVDPFVKGLGGERVTDLAGKHMLRPNADYLFPRHNVIAELKCLEAASFGEGFLKKMGTLMGKWHEEGRLRVYGTRMIDIDKLSPECQREVFDIMAAPLQKNVVVAANNQIKITKETLNMPNAKGLLWVASDGNEDLQPDVVMYLLIRILQKKHPTGLPAFSHIHGLVYFSPRMFVEVPQSPHPALIWCPYSRTHDEQMDACIEELGRAWPRYVAWAQGITVLERDEPATMGRDVRFLGVKERIPFIKMRDEDN